MVSGVFRIPLDVAASPSSSGRRGDDRPPLPLPEYISGPENALVRVAVSALPKLANQSKIGHPYNPIYFYGPPGTAKTMLGRTLTAMWQQLRPGQPVFLANSTRFMRGYTSAISRNQLEDWRGRFSKVAMLTLDDVDCLAGRHSTEEALVQLIDQFLADDRPVVITGCLHPRNLTHLSPRLAGRLSSGLTVPLCPPGLEARCLLFRQLAATRHLRCTEAAARFAAQHIDGSVRELGKLFQNVVSNQYGKQTTIEQSDVQAVVTQMVDRDVSPRTIIRLVARHYQFPIAQLIGPSRRQSLVRARVIAIYVIRELTGSSFQKIGRYFSGRDHTTVLHAYRRAQSLMKNDPATQQVVLKLLAPAPPD